MFLDAPQYGGFFKCVYRKHGTPIPTNPTEEEENYDDNQNI